MKTQKVFEEEIPAGFLDESLSTGSMSVGELESFEASKTETLDGGQHQGFAFSYNSENGNDARGLTVPVLGHYWDIIKDSVGDLVDEKHFKEKGWKMPFYWAANKIFNYLSKDLLPPSKRKNKLLDLAGDFLDTQSQKAETNLKECKERSFKGFLKFKGMFNGSTIIDEMYTVLHRGKYLPIFMKSKKGQKPSEAEVVENIKFVREKNLSPYYKTTIQKEGKQVVQPKYPLTALLDAEFLEMSMKEFTCGDSENYGVIREPIREWIARFDTWLISQYGEMREEVVGGERVRVFKRPSSWRLGLSYIIGDVVTSFRSGLSKAYMDWAPTFGKEREADYLLNTKYKRIFTTLMGYLGARSEKLAYEF